MAFDAGLRRLVVRTVIFTVAGVWLGACAEETVGTRDTSKRTGDVAAADGQRDGVLPSSTQSAADTELALALTLANVDCNSIDAFTGGGPTGCYFRNNNSVPGFTIPYPGKVALCQQACAAECLKRQAKLIAASQLSTTTAPTKTTLNNAVVGTTPTVVTVAQANPEVQYPDYMTWTGPAGKTAVGQPLITFASNSFLHGPNTVGLPPTYSWEAPAGIAPTYMMYGPYLRNIAAGHFEAAFSVICPTITEAQDNTILAVLDVFDGALSPAIAFASVMVDGRKCRTQPNQIFKLDFTLPTQSDHLEGRIFVTGAATVQSAGVVWNYYGQDPAPATSPVATVVNNSPFPDADTTTSQYSYNLTTAQINQLNLAISGDAQGKVQGLEEKVAQDDKALAAFSQFDPAVLDVKAKVQDAIAAIDAMVLYVNAPGYVDSRGYFREALFDALAGYSAIQGMLYNDLALNKHVAGAPAFLYSVDPNFATDYNNSTSRGVELYRSQLRKFAISYQGSDGHSYTATAAFNSLDAAVTALNAMAPIYNGARAEAILDLRGAQAALGKEYNIP